MLYKRPRRRIEEDETLVASPNQPSKPLYGESAASGNSGSSVDSVESVVSVKGGEEGASTNLSLDGSKVCIFDYKAKQSYLLVSHPVVCEK